MPQDPNASSSQNDTTGSNASPVKYISQFRSFKERLLGMYQAEGAILSKKEVPWRLGATWGYRLAELDGVRASEKLTGASIGEDEIKLFFDFCSIIKPAVGYVIGHAFGLSTFCLALACPEAGIVAIDNWRGGEGGILAKSLTERIIQSQGLKNVQVYSGSSPEDTPAALATVERITEGGKLSIVFIDGLHTNQAALADFTATLPYLDRRSVVMWHNIHGVNDAFESAYEEKGRFLFDQHQVLLTQGPMGIYYSSAAYPLLQVYLEDNSLLWPDWEKYLLLLMQEKWLLRQLEIRQKPAWKAAATLYHGLRRKVNWCQKIWRNH